MPIQVQGNSGAVAEVGGTGFRALRIENRPVEYGSLGTYRVNALSGTIAAGIAANSQVFHCRWTDATRFALIWAVRCDGLQSLATGFTAGVGKLEAMFARSWTADGSGGTTLTLTGNNQKLRTSMGTSLMGAIRIATTGALTAGTSTLDTQGLGAVNFDVGTAVQSTWVEPLSYLIDSDSTVNFHPVVLAQNEGLIVRTTMPATGTWQVGFTMVWSEVAAF